MPDPKPRPDDPTPPPAGAVQLRLREVAWVLRCSTSTVRRLLAEGKLPATQATPGATRTVPAAALEAFRKAATTTASPDQVPAPARSSSIKAEWTSGVDHFGAAPRKGRRKPGPAS